jgi:hypothetical protein
MNDPFDIPNSSPNTKEEATPQGVIAQTTDALAALFTEISEAQSQPFIDPLEHLDGTSTPPLDPEEDIDADEWHDLDQFIGCEPRLENLFDKAQRREILVSLRRSVRTQLATPRTILLRDKITFTLGTLDLLISAYWLGASPKSFYKLYSVKAVVLLFIRFFYYRSKRWHYYMFDLCYAVQILIFINVWIYPENIMLSKVTFAFCLGPLLWSILAFRNSLVYHSLDKVTSLFLHFFPACVAWAHRFHPPEALESSFVNHGEEGALRKLQWDTASPWELCILPISGPYLLWSILYFLKIFVISSKKIQERDYETLYNYVTSRKGLFSVVVLRFPRKLQPLAYQVLHMALTMAVMALNTIWWSNSTAALGFIVAAFVVAAWHGASFYFDHFAHRYVAGLGIEPKFKKKSPLLTGPPVSEGLVAGGRGLKAE